MQVLEIFLLKARTPWLLLSSWRMEPRHQESWYWASHPETLQWRHNGRDGVSNNQPHDCLLNHLSRHRSKKTSKLCVTGLCVGNSPVNGEFPAQRASNAENVSMSLWYSGVATRNGEQWSCITPILQQTIPDKFCSTINNETLQKAVSLSKVIKKEFAPNMNHMNEY